MTSCSTTRPPRFTMPCMRAAYSACALRRNLKPGCSACRSSAPMRSSVCMTVCRQRLALRCSVYPELLYQELPLMPKPPPPVTDNPWQTLRRFTAARIALGRAGVSLPTAPQLAFQLAHAQARDAVHLALDAELLRRQLAAAGIAGAAACRILDSAAGDRLTYLQRPDLGRRLSAASHAALESAAQADAAGYDLAFVIADGLSSLAISKNALPFCRRCRNASRRGNGRRRR